MFQPKLNPIEPPWYGPVCPVVWEGRRREASPYPDQSAQEQPKVWGRAHYGAASSALVAVLRAAQPGKGSSLPKRRDVTRPARLGAPEGAPPEWHVIVVEAPMGTDVRIHYHVARSKTLNASIPWPRARNGDARLASWSIARLYDREGYRDARACRRSRPEASPTADAHAIIDLPLVVHRVQHEIVEPHVALSFTQERIQRSLGLIDRRAARERTLLR